MTKAPGFKSKKPASAEEDDDDIVDPAPVDEAVPEDDEEMEDEEAEEDEETSEPPAGPEGVKSAPGLGGKPAPDEEQSGEEPDAESNVTPEEQADYDLFVGQAMNMIAKPEHQKFRDSLVKLLSAGSDRVAALASAATRLVEGVEKSANQAGKEFSADILLHAGQEIVELLAEFAQAKKIHSFTPDEVDAAFLQAVDLYRMNNKDKVDPQAAQQELQEIAAAEKQGNIDEVAPGLREAAMKGQELAQSEGAA